MKRTRLIDTPMVDGSDRRGAALVFALIALLVGSLMISSLLRTASMSHRQLKREEFRIQASLLADAGCERAIFQLQQQPEWTRSEWEISKDLLGSGRSGLVRLSVAEDPQVPGRRIVTAQAEFPSGQPEAVRITRHRQVP